MQRVEQGDVLLDAAEIAVDDLLDDTLASLISAESGIFAISDPRVLSIAHESASHARGEKAALAYFTTGQAALESGYTQDALDYLRQADRLAGKVLQAEVFSWLVHANVLATGSTSDEILNRAESFLAGIESDASDGEDKQIVRSIIHALLIAACQRGLQGMLVETRSYLEAADQISDRFPNVTHESLGLLRSWVVALDGTGASYESPYAPEAISRDYDGYGRTFKAFDLAKQGEYDQALTILESALDELAPIRGRDRWSETTVGSCVTVRALRPTVRPSTRW